MRKKKYHLWIWDLGGKVDTNQSISSSSFADPSAGVQRRHSDVLWEESWLKIKEQCMYLEFLRNWWEVLEKKIKNVNFIYLENAHLLPTMSQVLFQAPGILNKTEKKVYSKNLHSGRKWRQKQDNKNIIVCEWQNWRRKLIQKKGNVLGRRTGRR